MKSQVAQFVPYTDKLNLPVEVRDPDKFGQYAFMQDIEKALKTTKNIYMVKNGNIYYLSRYGDSYTFTTGVTIGEYRGAPVLDAKVVNVTLDGITNYDAVSLYGTTRPYLENPSQGTVWGFAPGLGANWYASDDVPCLYEDSLVTMSDGTYKKISEVKTGEEILSYDIESGENVTAFILNCYPTGFANKWDVNYFDNGKSIITYGRHAIYDPENEVSVNIQDIKPEFVANYIGGTTNFIKREVSTSVCQKRRYNIVSSNNLYYINGILMANAPYQKYATITEDMKSRLDREILDSWKNEYDAYYNAMTEKMTNSYAEEVAEIYKGTKKGKDKDNYRKDKNSKYLERRKNEFKTSNKNNKNIKVKG